MNFDDILKELHAIGIPAQESPGIMTGFLPYICIEGGMLYIDRRCPISDILHEAGHIAVFPAEYRDLICGDVSYAQKLLLRALDRKMRANEVHPDDAFYRAVMATGDPEVTAWAWAFGKFLGIPEDKIIDHGYGDNWESVRLGLSLNAYIGIHGLAFAGWCVAGAGYTAQKLSARSGIPVFPKLARWT